MDSLRPPDEPVAEYDAIDHLAASFVYAAAAVCAEAEQRLAWRDPSAARQSDQVLDMTLMPQLMFIEKVLNGA